MQIIFGLLGVGVFLAAMSMHGSAMAFVDLASLCFVVGGTVLFSLAHIPFSDIKGAFKLAFAQGPIQRKDAQGGPSRYCRPFGSSHLRLACSVSSWVWSRCFKYG